MVETVELTGRERVRQVLLEPVDRAGAKRRGRMTLAEHHAMKERLAEAFAHMPELALQGLRDFVFRYLDGPGGDHWPSEAWLRKHGLRLCPKPARSNPYVQSLMASKMGRDAVAGGYGAELMLLAMKLGPPPGRYDLTRIRREADRAAREAEVITRQREEGRAMQADLDWLAGRERAQKLAAEMAKGAGQ